MDTGRRTYLINPYINLGRGSSLPRLSEVGEVGALKLIEALTRAYYGGDLPYWEDAAALKVGDKWLIISIDGTHSEYSLWPWMSIEDLGYRVVIGSATDVIAKGGMPFGVAVSLGAPASSEIGDLKELMRGVIMALDTIGAQLLGGDTNRSPRGWWVDAVAMGWARRPVPANFVPGKLCATSCLGYSALNEAVAEGCEVPEDLLVRAVKPEPPTDFTRISEKAVAATDISDGVSSLLKHLVRRGLSARLYEGVVCEDVLNVLEGCGKDAAWVLNHLGEEYVIVYQGGDCLCEIGELIESDTPGVSLGDKPVELGWDNFLGRSRIGA